MTEIPDVSDLWPVGPSYACKPVLLEGPQTSGDFPHDDFPPIGASDDVDELRQLQRAVDVMLFSNQSYDSQTLAAMTSAFDAAWTAVLAGNLAGSLSQEQAREQLAKRIMRAVDQGDTDQERLTLIAIKFFDSRVQAN